MAALCFVDEEAPMEFTVKGRRIRIEYQSILLTTVILGWSVYYYFATVHTPDGGAESVLFIKPLLILLAICYPFVLRSAIHVHPLREATEKRETSLPSDGDRGFMDPRRIFFAASLAVYAGAMTFFGYLIPTVLFVSFVCFYLGVRKYWILIGLPILLAVFLSVVFRLLIGVPIPVWPWES
jgi:hypothetical protein